MKKKWDIRQAIVKDSIELQECMELAYASYKDRMEGKQLPPMDVNYSDEIRSYPSWVVVSGNKVVGGLFMMFENEYAYIVNIAIHPDFQGQGLGGGPMKFAETKAKDKEYSELRLATHILLIENVSLYLYLGWTEIDRDEVRIYMKKVI